MKCVRGDTVLNLYGLYMGGGRENNNMEHFQLVVLFKVVLVLYLQMAT